MKQHTTTLNPRILRSVVIQSRRIAVLSIERFRLQMSDKQPMVDDTRITPGALRMRASRRRRREGLRCVTLDLRKNEIERLIQLGHLRPIDREDRNQVLLALYCFLDQSPLGDAHP